MGTIEDHKEVVALRMANRLDALATEKSIYKHLTECCRWSEADAQEIVARAKQIHERRKGK